MIPADYEPVEERLAKFWADNAGGRVVTTMLSAEPIIVFKAEIHREGEADPFASGHAHQRILEAAPSGRGGKANEFAPEWTSPFEVCETSAVGRALANGGYAPKGKRPSREEAQAANRVAQPAVEELKARVELLDPQAREEFTAWKNDQGFPWPWPQPAIDAMHAKLDAFPAELPLAVDRHGYDAWSRDELSEEAARRSLPHSGTKDRLIAELSTYDIVHPDEVPDLMAPSERPF